MDTLAFYIHFNGMQDSVRVVLTCEESGQAPTYAPFGQVKLGCNPP